MPLISSDLIPALLEASQQLSEAEQSLDTPQDNIAVSYDLEAGLAEITASLPVETNSSNAGITVSCSDYAPVTDFEASSVLPGGATLTNAAQAIAIISEKINREEAVLEENGQPLPDGAGVGLTVNLDTQVLNITAAIPIGVTIDSQGRPVVTAVNYLV